MSLYFRKKLLKAGHIRKQNDEDVQKESIADLEEKVLLNNKLLFSIFEMELLI